MIPEPQPINKTILKWCRKCRYLTTQFDAYSRWFAKCQYGFPHMADEQLHYERRIVSFYHNKAFPGSPFDHLMKYDDKSAYSKKEEWMKPDLNIIPEPQFLRPEGCPWALEMLMDNQSDNAVKN